MVWRSLHHKEILLSEPGRNRRECILTRNSPLRKKKLYQWKSIMEIKIIPSNKMHFQWVILQSHYPNRRSPDGRWAKNGKIGRHRPIVGRHRSRFLQIFWSADDFFVEATKLKVSLTDPPIFRGFVIGEASGDGRPMIGRQSADFLKIFTSWNRPTVARSSGVNRPLIARWSVDDILSNNRRQTDAWYRPSFGRRSPDCRPIITFHLCYIVYNACVRIIYEINNHGLTSILFWDSFRVQVTCFFLGGGGVWGGCWISNWTIHMTFRDKLHLKYCNLVLNILIYMEIAT